jgi:hypothetical protein
MGAEALFMAFSSQMDMDIVQRGQADEFSSRCMRNAMPDLSLLPGLAADINEQARWSVIPGSALVGRAVLP